MAEFQSHRAGVRPFRDALPKTVVAGPKNGPENAIAWDFFPVTNEASAVTTTVRARVLRDRDSV